MLQEDDKNSIFKVPYFYNLLRILIVFGDVIEGIVSAHEGVGVVELEELAGGRVVGGALQHGRATEHSVHFINNLYNSIVIKDIKTLIHYY